jgi:hypothetical protein
VLPFPPTPSASKAGPTLQESTHKRRVEPTRLPKNAPNALIVLSADGKEVARTTVKMTVPAVFTASESLDVGVDLGSTVSRDYYERRPSKFDGRMNKVDVQLK